MPVGRQSIARGRNAVRIAIVGSGYIGRVHARVAQELGGTVVAVCGRTLASAEAFGVGETYDHLGRLLAEQKPDVVHICTPNNLHAEQAIAAFAAGAHVVCEKPLATSSDEALRMIDAADRAGRFGATMYNYRGYPLVETIRGRIAAGELGALRRVGGCYLSEDVHPAGKYVWHFTPGIVGPAFALMDLGVHWFDLVEYVTGQKIVEITAQFSTHQRRRIWRGGPGEGPRPPGRAEADGSIAVDIDVEDQADLLVRLCRRRLGQRHRQRALRRPSEFDPHCHRRFRAGRRLAPAGAGFLFRAKPRRHARAPAPARGSRQCRHPDLPPQGPPSRVPGRVPQCDGVGLAANGDGRGRGAVVRRRPPRPPSRRGGGEERTRPPHPRDHRGGLRQTGRRCDVT